MAQRSEARELKEPREVDDQREPSSAQAEARPAAPDSALNGKPYSPASLSPDDGAEHRMAFGGPASEELNSRENGARSSAPLESLSSRDEPIPLSPAPPVAGPWRSYKEILA